MKVSRIIEQLQEIQQLYGDIDFVVVTHKMNHKTAKTEPVYHPDVYPEAHDMRAWPNVVTKVRVAAIEVD